MRNFHGLVMLHAEKVVTLYVSVDPTDQDTHFATASLLLAQLMELPPWDDKTASKKKRRQ